MSDNEELLAIGRLVKDAAATKVRVALLKGNLEALAAALTTAGGQITGTFQGVSYADLEANIQAIPTAEAVSAALAEFEAEKKRSAELSARVAQLGV